MERLGNILNKGLLILFSSIMLLSPLLSEYVITDKESDKISCPYVASQYSFSSSDSSFGSCLVNLNIESNTVPVNLTSSSGFSSSMLEKILFYSHLRERILSRGFVNPFSQYIFYLYGAQSKYFVYALREIII